MKKRIISLLLMLVMCVTLVSTSQVREVQAAETEAFVIANTWAIPDLMYGETYGIYPVAWNEKGFIGTITQGKLRVLLAGIRHKLLDTNCATESGALKPVLDSSLTVKEVLNAFYLVLSNYDYTVDLGLDNKLTPVEYMKRAGIYTGTNGEQALKDICSIEQALVIATRIVTFVYDTLDAASKGFLWEVKSGENTVYLLGSIHVASYSIYPFSDTMLKAYQSSDALIVEANLYDQADTTAFSQMMYYTDGTTLKDHVSAESYQKSIETAALLGIPEETAAMLKPWALYSTFSNYTLAGNSKNDQNVIGLGIDMAFLTNAYVNQKPVYAIEGLVKQGTIFDSFSKELQEYLLNVYSDAAIDVINGTVDEETMDLNEYTDLMLQYWHDGNTEDCKVLLNQDDDAFDGELSKEEKVLMEEFTDKLLTKRDKGMADNIESLLKSEGSSTYFVVVGAAHYLGDNSVIDILEDKGYVITRVK